jgi:hypothetical protein
MILSKTITQPNKRGYDTSLDIEVKVNDDTYEVEHILSIKAFCFRRLVETDITYILSEHFPSMLDEIHEIDWRQVALDQQPEPEPMRSDLFEQMANVVKIHNKINYGI